MRLTLGKGQRRSRRVALSRGANTPRACPTCNYPIKPWRRAYKSPDGVWRCTNCYRWWEAYAEGREVIRYSNFLKPSQK